MLAREILQSQQVTFEVTLIVKVNVENSKNRHSAATDIPSVGMWHRKRGIRIDSTAYANQFLYKFNHPTRAKPAGHWCWRFRCRPDNQELTDARRICSPSPGLLRQFACESTVRAGTRYVFPREASPAHAIPCVSASVEKPGRPARDKSAQRSGRAWRMRGEIGLDLLGRPR